MQQGSPHRARNVASQKQQQFQHPRQQELLPSTAAPPHNDSTTTTTASPPVQPPSLLHTLNPLNVHAAKQGPSMGLSSVNYLQQQHPPTTPTTVSSFHTGLPSLTSSPPSLLAPLDHAHSNPASAMSSPARRAMRSPRPSFNAADGSRTGRDGATVRDQYHHPPPPPLFRPSLRTSAHDSGPPSSSASHAATPPLFSHHTSVHLNSLSRPTSPDSTSSSAYAYTNANSQAFRNVHGSTASLTSANLQPNGSTVSAVSSRVSSRRPSLVTLQSFLEGVNHVTRVRSPSISRGHSRSTSLEEAGLPVSTSGFPRRSGSTSAYSGTSGDDLSPFETSGSGRPWHLDDVDEMPAWEDGSSSAFLTPSSPTPRPPSEHFNYRPPSHVSLRRSALFPAEHGTAPTSLQSSPMPIRSNNRHDFSAADDDDDLGERTFVDRRDSTLFPKHAGLHMDDEDEERHLRNLEESSWSEQDLNLLQEGDRLGIGLTHEGLHIVNALDATPDSPGGETEAVQYEIVRQLGYGSYAIVYLVKEVLYDELDEDAPFSHDDSDSYMNGSRIVYGREFALKCLSKKNLTDEQIAIQRFEATLHRAIPPHPNVVELHQAFETPAWLFLVLEYCPGQDLYFWLEQARDSEGIDGDPSRAPSRLSNSRAGIPASAITRALQQHAMANGMAAQTVFEPPLGESPSFGSFNEKEATPPSPSLLTAHTANALLSRRRLRLISRMFVQMCDALQACHDAGVSHRDIKPENIIIVDNRAEMGTSGKVVIKVTDWGLGTLDKRCEDFDCGSKPYMAYECRNNLRPSYEPKGADVWSLGIVLLNLLFHRCPWADPVPDDPDFAEFRKSPIEFLETRFEGIGNDVALFLAQRVFNEVEIADALPRVTAGEFGRWASNLVRYMGEGGRRASVSDAAHQLHHTIRHSPRMEGARLFQTNGTPKTSSLFNPSDDSADASPSRRLQKLPIEEHQHAESEEVLRTARLSSFLVQDHDADPDQTVEAVTDDLNDLDVGEDRDGTNEGGTASSKSKRRRRGARKKHRMPGEHGSSSVTEPTSPAFGPVEVQGRVKSDDLNEVSQNLQALAREISQTTRQSSPVVSAHPSPIVQPIDAAKAARPTKSRFADRLKGAFANGNPDLQAFTERARQRDLALTGGVPNPTSSAPAKMQQVAFNATGSGVSSIGSTGSWSEDGQNHSHWASTGSRRERVGGGKRSEAASSRSHERSSRPTRYHHSSLGHMSATASASSSPSRQSFTPLSSFSSTTSYESRGASRPPKPSLHSIDEAVSRAVYGKKDASTSTSSLVGTDTNSTVSPPILQIEPSDYPFPSSQTRTPMPTISKLPSISPPAAQQSFQPPPPKQSVEQKAISSRSTVPASQASQVIREPINPPAESSQPTGSKAKLGRLFKFSRG